MNNPTDRAENHNVWPRAPVMRSRFAIEVAAELIAFEDMPFKRARVQLRERDFDSDWPINLFASSTMEGIDAVAKGEATLSMINPAVILTMAYRGTGLFSKPLPLRLIATFPSPDACLFAVKKDLGLKSFEDIAARKIPLKLSVREQKDHCLHMVFDDVARAAEFSAADLQSWGGGLQYDASPRNPKGDALASGAHAIFEEAAWVWASEALDLGLDLLPMSDAMLAKLEAIGYRRTTIRKAEHPRLERDIVTLDFSGWGVFVREDAPDRLVEQICAAVEKRKHLIPWQGDGPLPVERMCRDTPDTPMDVPLHRAAEKFWKSQGYI